MTKNLTNILNFILKTADLIRDIYKKSEYSGIILTFTVLRRLDCALEPTRDKVHQTYIQYATDKYGTKLDDPSKSLKIASGYNFYNTSNYNFEKLLEEPNNIKNNFNTYINSFSQNIREILDKFRLNVEIEKLVEEDVLYTMIERFTSNEIDLSPNSLSNHQMGYIFEELIREFDEQSNENPEDHFTPREIIKLMVNILMSKDKDELSKEGKTVTIYDPACGTGGMLTIAKDHILKDNPNAIIHFYGQERNDKTYATCKSDLLIKGESDENIKNIKFGSSFSNDKLFNMKFDYMLSNPPYGKDWKQDEKFIKNEHNNGSLGRFEAGLPNIGDGQLLFLQHMISKMHKPESGEVTRIAIVFNGSPLFTGDAGSGESEIRRWIIENDWLEAIIALPDQLFYNTSISTYVWILTNRKEEEKIGKITLINAVDFYETMNKNLGKKRHEISDAQITEITKLYLQNTQNKRVKILDSNDLGYRKIIIDRPLRMNFKASDNRISLLENETDFKNLVKPEKGKKSPEKFIADGHIKQGKIIEVLKKMPDNIYYDYNDFINDVIAQLESVNVKPLATIKNAIKSALGEIDEAANVIRNSKGNMEYNLKLRDFEKVPLKEDVNEYFEREVIPYVADAWISDHKDHRDHKDSEIGKIGYEINFNKYFYEYQPPRSLGDIGQDLKKVQKEISELLGEFIK